MTFKKKKAESVNKVLSEDGETECQSQIEKVQYIYL